MKIFLGGTINDSKWRDELIPMLEENEFKYFNPVVDNWTEKHYQEEEKQKKICDICLYVITPRFTGTYSIAELIDASNKIPKKTVFVLLSNDRNKEFDVHQLKSIMRVKQMVDENGAKSFLSLKTFVQDLKKNDSSK